MHYKPAQQDGGFDVRTRKATEYGLSEYMSTKDTQFESTIKAILVTAANTKINWYGNFDKKHSQPKDLWVFTMQLHRFVFSQRLALEVDTKVSLAVGL